VSVAVKVQPKSRRPGIQGIAPDVAGVRLRLAVTEAAEDGRANRAVCALLADALGVAVSTVSVLQGTSSRQKTLLVEGDCKPLAARMASICNSVAGTAP
jgi:uncharacterized protein YggU (UPF0235/DUF167 family)